MWRYMARATHTDTDLAKQYAEGAITLDELNARAAEAGAAATTADAAPDADAGLKPITTKP